MRGTQNHNDMQTLPERWVASPKRVLGNPVVSEYLDTEHRASRGKLVIITHGLLISQKGSLALGRHQSLPPLTFLPSG